MSAVPKRKLTEQEYLAIERKAEFKSEFYNGEMFAMSGATYKHNRTKDNFARHLGNALAEGPCHVITSDMRVYIPSTGLYTYPDAIVLCEEPVLLDGHGDVLLNPRLIAEVLSKSTESYDRGKKFEHYRTVKTLREYLLLSQDRMAIDRYVRQDNGSWMLTSFSDPEGFLELGSLSVKIAMKDIYAGVKLDEEQ